MKISANNVVSLEYSLHLGDGEIIDRSDGEPLVYLHGAGQLIPGLERQLEGLSIGDARTFTVAAADGYGELDPDAIQEVPRTQFGGRELKVGDQFIAMDENQNQFPVRIKATTADTVTVDFNHPLAGKTLHFDIKVRDVRAASQEELAHGHAHGVGGHQH